jgi:hypothetical protein
VGFPESQGGAQVYGTPWPLSEKYYLCVYDPDMKTDSGRQGKKHVRGNYGIYLLDAFGNKELIHRDPAIGSLSPMPLRPRKKPPVIPDASQRLADKPSEQGTMALLNVYDSLKPFPEGTKIMALRLYQILPLSVASSAASHNTGIQIPQGCDSINLARKVLGTVPVETDGSAYFTVPAMKEIFIQALDKDGLAIQSMRSATWVQPGERLVCQGCHEPKYRAPRSPAKMAMALKHAPSIPAPDVDGTNPFSYPRLVQPVLDRNCVTCHQKEKKAPRLDAEPMVYKTPGGMNKTTTYYASYISLAPEFGFYDYGGKGWNDPKWYRTTPGEFGAMGSKLYKMLKDGHHDVKLSAEDMHRITVWLDSCSLFYGVYEKEGGQAQLRGEIARPTLE